VDSSFISRVLSGGFQIFSFSWISEYYLVDSSTTKSNKISFPNFVIEERK
jgi:hypothetical protein